MSSFAHQAPVYVRNILIPPGMNTVALGLLKKKKKKKKEKEEEEESQISIFYFVRCLRKLRYYSIVMQYTLSIGNQP